MPNHIKNIITAEPEVLAKIRDVLRSEERAVDFNRLIPMPGVVQLPEGKSGWPMHVTSRANDIMGVGVSDNPLIASLERSNRERDRRTHPITGFSKDDFEMLLGCMRALYEVGEVDSLDWSRSNWGTKWNAYGIEISDTEICFETAWSMPKPILLKLAEQKLGDFTWSFADEDLGYNCGIRKVAADGTIVEVPIEGDAEKWAYETLYGPEGWEEHRRECEDEG